jgi:molecular chaperone GrpE
VTEPRHAAPDHEPPQVVVNDRRRIDPETGEIRVPAHDATVEEGAAPAEDIPVVAEIVDEVAAELKTQLDERTADLQRLTAEYANYRKRVERDREAVINNAPEGDQPARIGCPARARAYTIPKSSEGRSRKAGAGRRK